MTIRSELHCHTTASDGVIVPSLLFEEARDCGITHLVVTDHDTFDGYSELLKHSLIGPKLFPGIELSASYDGQDVHILGYFVDPHDRLLLTACEQTLHRRKQRTLIMAERLMADGYKCSGEDFEALGLTTINRANLARVLTLNGHAETIMDAFDIYLSEDSPYYEPRGDMDAREAIELIRGSGGIAVIAHPYHYGLVDLIPYFVSQGLGGIEAFHSEHPLSVARHLEQMGHEMDILVTGGSDYHGDSVHDAVLGGCQPSQEDLKKLFSYADD